MRLHWLVAALPICAFLMVGNGHAEDLKLRSGEHPEFSRLVLPLPPSTKWNLGRSEAGYALRIVLPGVALDTSRVFDLIPRTRIKGLRTGESSDILYIDLSCSCHAVATQQPGGQLIIDVADGPPQKTSKFELPLDAVGHTATPDVQVSARPLPHPTRGAPKSDVALAATILFKPIVSSDGTQSIRWELPSVTTIDRPESSHGLDGRVTERPKIALMPRSAEIPVTTIAEPVGHPELPGPHVKVTEAELLRQLSRAAAQGLVRVDPLKRPARPRSEPATAAGADPHLEAHEEEASSPSRPAIHVETSMDQAVPAESQEQSLTPDGDICIPDDDVALSTWGSDDPADQQIANARANLLGEFDRPDAGKVEILVRLYLFLGMGAEARFAQQAFNVGVKDASLLADIGRILDDEPVSPFSELHRMRECNSAVALWAFLAAPTSDDVRFTPVAPVVRGFLSLPPHLRLTLGPRISSRLIDVGAFDGADTIANTLSRQAGDTDRAARMIDARLDIHMGQTARAEANLAKIPANNDELSASAIELAARTRLARGEKLEPKLVDTIASLAFEHQANPDGGRLAGLEVIARASSGDFKGALAAFERWSKDQPDLDQSGTAHNLFDLLAKRATDEDFIALYFDGKAVFQNARNDLQLRLSVARRLADLGFADEVEQVLADAAGDTKEGKILRARAALSLYSPQDAIALVDGLVGEDAAHIRSTARIMLGDVPEAEGMATASTAGEKLDFAPEDSAGGKAETTLAGSRAALKDSEALRQSIAALLADSGDTQSSP